MDSDKCFQILDQIIDVLDNGFKYLATEPIEKTVIQKHQEEQQAIEDKKAAEERAAQMVEVVEEEIYDDQTLDRDEDHFVG